MPFPEVDRTLPVTEWMKLVFPEEGAPATDTTNGLPSFVSRNEEQSGHVWTRSFLLLSDPKHGKDADSISTVNIPSLLGRRPRIPVPQTS